VVHICDLHYAKCGPHKVLPLRSVLFDVMRSMWLWVRQNANTRYIKTTFTFIYVVHITIYCF